jgi:hypothetical protein
MLSLTCFQRRSAGQRESMVVEVSFKCQFLFLVHRSK